MEHAYKFVLRYGSILAVVLIIAWPLLALAAGTFSRPYFYFWVIISIIWGLVRARRLRLRVQGWHHRVAAAGAGDGHVLAALVLLLYPHLHYLGPSTARGL